MQLMGLMPHSFVMQIMRLTMQIPFMLLVTVICKLPKQQRRLLHRHMSYLIQPIMPMIQKFIMQLTSHTRLVQARHEPAATLRLSPSKCSLHARPRELPCHQPIKPCQLWSQLVQVDSLHTWFSCKHATSFFFPWALCFLPRSSRKSNWEIKKKLANTYSRAEKGGFGVEEF